MQGYVYLKRKLSGGSILSATIPAVTEEKHNFIIIIIIIFFFFWSISCYRKQRSWGPQSEASVCSSLSCGALLHYTSHFYTNALLHYTLGYITLPWFYYTVNFTVHYSTIAMYFLSFECNELDGK